MDYLDRIPDREPDDELALALEELAFRRKQIAEKKAQAKKVMEEAMESSGYNALKTQLIAELENEAALDKFIRERAVERSEACLPLPKGVQVKSFKAVVIADLNKAKDWCLKNMIPALQLDIDILQKAILGNMVPEEIGYISHENKTLIAQDLEQYYAKI